MKSEDYHRGITEGFRLACQAMLENEEDVGEAPWILDSKGAELWPHSWVNHDEHPDPDSLSEGDSCAHPFEDARDRCLDAANGFFSAWNLIASSISTDATVSEVLDFVYAEGERLFGESFSSAVTLGKKASP